MWCLSCSGRIMIKNRINEFLNSNLSLIMGLWVSSQHKMMDKSTFPKDSSGYQLNRWMVNNQLNDCLELVKNVQQWAVGGKKREASKHHLTEEHERLLCRNLTAQLCMCFYLYNGFSSWILELQCHINFD